MVTPYKHKRSPTIGATPSSLLDGELALRYAAADPALLFRDSNGNITHVLAKIDGGEILFSSSSASAQGGGPVSSSSSLVEHVDSSSSSSDEAAISSSSSDGSDSLASSSSSASAGEAFDADFSNVALLLHGDGNLTDASIHGHAVTAVGNAAATGGAKYGSASIAFDGNQDWLSIPASTEFDFPGDFTIEFWVYFNGNAPPTLGAYGTAILARYDGYSAGANKGWQVRIDGETYTTVYVYTGATSLNMSGAAISQNVWHHVAVVRSGSTIKSYLDGVQYGDPVTNSEPFVPSTALPLYAGAIVTEPPEGYRLYLNGRLDDIRITKGVARYLSTFTPPTSAFADYAALVVPNAPTGLTATPSDQAVALSWSLPAFNGAPAITDYVVQYSSDAGSNWTTVSDGTSTTRSATVPGLTNGTEYLFRVAAVNSVGTSSYSSTVASTPVVASVLTITAQPQNTYSATNTDTATFSVTASITGGATITYQWQYYGWDSNYMAYGWNNISGQTSSTLSIAPNTSYSMGIINDFGVAATPFRCVVTGSNNAGTLTSNSARWVLFSNMYWEINAYGENGAYSNSSTTVNGVSYYVLSLSAAENLIINYYDDGFPGDSSWYTGNAFTLKLQVSDDASTWTDLQTVNTQSTGWYDYFTVAALSGVTKYYRVALDINWPFTVTNGTTSARSAPATTYSSRYQVTWP